MQYVRQRSGNGYYDNYLDEIYTDLAWGGLRGTPIYDENFPKVSKDYIRIEARYAAESNGGTSGNQMAIGKPCKN